MAKFYGQVKGIGRTAAHQAGNSDGIRASVQSYDGSVIVGLNYYPDKTLNVRVEVAEGSKFSGKTVFDGTLDEFVQRLNA